MAGLRKRGAVPFPLSGREGDFVRLTGSDLLHLREKYGENYLMTCALGCENADPQIIETILLAGLRDLDGNRIELSLDSVMDFRADGEDDLQAIGAPLIDALYLSVMGKTADEVIAEARRLQESEEAQKLKAAQNMVTALEEENGLEKPDAPLTDGSTPSKKPRSKRASRRKSSTG